MRRHEMHPNGRKMAKRIRKFRPLYSFNPYDTDQPWDVLGEKQVQVKVEEEDSDEDSIEIEQELQREASSSLLKEQESMSK
jgi:hypothetical protein